MLPSPNGDKAAHRTSTVASISAEDMPPASIVAHLSAFELPGPSIVTLIPARDRPAASLVAFLRAYDRPGASVAASIRRYEAVAENRPPSSPPSCDSAPRDRPPPRAGAIPPAADRPPPRLEAIPPAAERPRARVSDRHDDPGSPGSSHHHPYRAAPKTGLRRANGGKDRDRWRSPLAITTAMRHPGHGGDR